MPAGLEARWKAFFPAAQAAVVIVAVSIVSGLAFNALRPEPLPLFPTAPNGETTFSDFATLDSHLALPGTILLDARDEVLFSLGRIPGAANVPPETLSDPDLAESFSSSIPKDALVIVYCSEPLCPLADGLAVFLRERGRGRVMVFSPGFEGWLGEGRTPEE
ncbi:MAG: rhodanese-like domain-containing protein [Deltaproteobacteria bacterium]|nr:rhodanese-like domain-containing protein [Deltaproteobacteria bacterium]